MTRMGLIRENTLAIYTARKGFEELMDFLAMIQGMVGDIAPVSIEPGYATARSLASPTRTYTVALPPHTFFIYSENIIPNPQCNPNDRCYILVRPSWIKTISINIVFVKEILGKIHGREEGLIQLDNAAIKLVYDEQLQNPPVIVDGIFRYNSSWMTGRKSFLDETYIKIIRETIENKPSRDILAHDGTKPVIYLEHGKTPQLVLHYNESLINEYARIYLDTIIDFIAILYS